jgi:hypothetical protein
VTRIRADLPQIQDKRAQVVRLRAEGQAWDQIAAATGYSNGSGALKAWRAAIKQKPDLAVTEIRAAERERLEQMDAELARIISTPPVKSGGSVLNERVTRSKRACFPGRWPPIRRLVALSHHVCMDRMPLGLDELIERWTVLDDERKLIAGKRGPTRLGFAVLLKFFTQHGRFPPGRSELPDEAIDFVARQVKVPASDIGFYKK